MSYHVVEQRPGQRESSIELDGRTFPTPSIVEDEDGIRLLWITNFFLSVDTWLWAHAQGVVALVHVEANRYVLTSDFSEERTESSMGNLVLAEDRWAEWTSGMSYADMLGVQPESPVGEPDAVQDDAVRPEGFVHLHTHTEFSQLDGVTKINELMNVVVAEGQPAVAVTDHGNCAAHAALQLAATKAGVKPIFGMEANFVPDRTVKTTEIRHAYWHLVLWAENDAGLKNLWALSTDGYRDDARYDRPRIDWELLERYSEGLIVSTACLRGPVVDPYLKGDEAAARANLSRLRAIFGDRVYIELHANQLSQQIQANEWLVALSAELDVPLVAVVDSHYDGHVCDREDHQVWISMQINKDIADESDLFHEPLDLHLMTEVEVRQALSYIDSEVVDEAVANTVRIADRCTAEIISKPARPKYSKATTDWPDPVEHDVDRLWGVIESRWEERLPVDADEQEYLDRIAREMKLLVDKGFCGYFLMVREIVAYAKSTGILVGPGRGSGGGSLVAYVLGITEIDPVASDLLFERFMTEGREALPDFDIDFPSSKRPVMFDFVSDRWGAEHVCVVGTVTRLKSKSLMNSLFKALGSTLPAEAYIDNNKINKIIDEAEASTAGLGLAWDDLLVVEEDRLEPFIAKYPTVFALADRMHGRVKSFGSHPAGVVIDPDEPIIGNLPLRNGTDEHSPMVSQFDLEILEELGFVKFDLLSLRTLDTLQMVVDLVEETTGHRPDPYTWKRDEQYSDPQMYDDLSAGWSLGWFQVETQSGTRACKRFQPHSLGELANVITLVRPGPVRSGLTETYYRRMSGEEEVEYADPRLETVLAKTYGTMLYQEDIMAVCMVLAGYTSNEADEVRKILGKKKVEKVAAAGEQFIARAVENDTDREVAERLWEQMAEFAKYSFNRAHAFAYAILGVWTGWFKTHYQVQTLGGTLSTVDAVRIPEFVEEARRLGYGVLPPDINESGPGFTVSAMAVRYGLESVKGVGEAASAAILGPRTEQPYSSFEDFLDRKGSKCDSGQVRTLARIGAFDSLVPHRRGLLERMELEQIAGSDRCIWKTDEPVFITGPEIKGEPNQRELPCQFDWPSEPREPSKQAGRYKAPKPLPKKCSRACRQYTPIPLPDYDQVEPYTDEDIRQIELEILEVFLSSTPFDRIPDEIKEECSTAEQVLTGESGDHIVAGMVRGFRPHVDRNGRPMGWLKLATEAGELEVVVFGDERARYEEIMTPGRLVFAAVRHNSRGTQLVELVDLDEE